MMILRWVLLLTLAGCATAGNDGESGAQHAINSAKVHTELAASYFERMQYAVALQEVGVALLAHDAYAPAYNVRGLIRMALHEDDAAEADFRRSLKLEPGNSDTHNNFGWFLCQRGRYQESVQQFQEALKNPLYATPELAYANAGICSGKGGDAKAAESYLQRALILHPDMPQALFGLADAAFAGGDYAKAKSWFLRYQQTGAELNAEQLWLAVRIERKMRDHNSEASYALQLGKRFPESREAQLLQAGQ